MSELLPVEEGVLAAETRRLAERGYTVYRGGGDLLPPPLKNIQPDAVAVGREPNYVIELVTDESASAEKLKRLRQEIAEVPGWKLLVLLDRGTRSRALDEASLELIDATLESASNVLVSGEAAPALLLGWGIFEALARRLVPGEFQRPQTPGRLIQILASRGFLTVNEEAFLRRLASVRNAVIHGELSKTAASEDVREFMRILRSLRVQAHHDDLIVR